MIETNLWSCLVSENVVESRILKELIKCFLVDYTWAQRKEVGCLDWGCSYSDGDSLRLTTQFEVWFYAIGHQNRLSKCISGFCSPYENEGECRLSRLNVRDDVKTKERIISNITATTYMGGTPLRSGRAVAPPKKWVSFIQFLSIYKNNNNLFSIFSPPTYLIIFSIYFFY